MICPKVSALAMPPKYPAAKPKPLKTANCLAASSWKNFLPLSGPAAYFSTSSTSLSVTTQPASFPLLKSFATPLVKQIDVADDRHVDAPGVEEQLDFVMLPHVVAELRNDPIRAAADLADQLEELRQQFALVAFERRDRAADEEMRLRQRFGLARAAENRAGRRSSTSAA